jgi:uncharacterized repeat protein (TIGR03803 family)
LALLTPALGPSLSSAQPVLTNFIRLKSFGDPNQAGGDPTGGFIESTDGFVYATASSGGRNENGGVVFKIKRDGSGFAPLHLFPASAFDGTAPTGDLLEYADALYGLAKAGGTYGAGAVFMMSKDGTAYNILHAFLTNHVDGKTPSARLIVASDGMLYGITTGGGTNSVGFGTAFKLAPNGASYQILHHFGTGASDGKSPSGSIVEGDDGYLYGTAQLGGSNFFGTVFKMLKDGSAYTNIHNFTGGTNGANPLASLLSASDGMLYGTMSAGGEKGAGAVFRMNRDGTGYSLLRSFQGPPNDGSAPSAALIEDTQGTLYGTTKLGGTNNAGVVFKMSRLGGSYAVLHQFATNSPDGVSPAGSLLKASDGSLYGLTTRGGPSGHGIAFRLASDGTGYEILRAFQLTSGDGKEPAGLIIASDDYLYGVAQTGGSNVDGGIVFRADRFGQDYKILHQFTGVGSDGAYPVALAGSQNTNLYGATGEGGVNAAGLLFKVAKDGSSFSVIHNFQSDGLDGRTIRSLVGGADGRIYGSTLQGGASNGGTVFGLNEDGTSYNVLLSFQYLGTNGWWPTALIQGSDGLLYGTTQNLGPDSTGTVFKISTNGTSFTVIHRFAATSADGQTPVGPLLEGSNGFLYGSTENGGSHNLGVIFSIDKSGSTYSVIHHFLGGATDGATPIAKLLEMSDGTLVGTTFQGGSSNCGVVFRLDKLGNSYQVLHDFSTTVEAGRNPSAIAAASHGGVFGITSNGGDLNAGTIFALFSEPRSWFSSCVSHSNQPTSLSAFGAATVAFELQTCTNLDAPTWAAIATNTASVIGSLIFSNQSANAQGFYRLMSH